jgi:P63C domain
MRCRPCTLALFRLRGLDYPTETVKRPQYFGKLTNDIIYRRMAPGVLAELKNVTARDDAGRRKHRFHQRLTGNVGYPKLREHLGSVVTLMKLSGDWADFAHKLDRIHPRIGDTIPLPFDEGRASRACSNARSRRVWPLRCAARASASLPWPSRPCARSPGPQKAPRAARWHAAPDPAGHPVEISHAGIVAPDAAG